jgi:TetR/AcrR family transcriptional regulator, transcriptional repressor for nem operon
MKKSKAETAETRKRILEVATQAFKHNGIRATGVSEIMAAAGLTHGGFYRHFASKEQLLAEACAASMETLVVSAETAAASGDAAFMKHIAHFLSTEYRDDNLGGCPLVAMGSELARADMDTRRAASQGFRELIDIVARWSQLESASSARAEAIFTLSSMIGAVTVARIVDDPKLSNQILSVAKKRLAIPATKSPRRRATAARA